MLVRVAVRPPINWRTKALWLKARAGMGGKNSLTQLSIVTQRIVNPADTHTQRRIKRIR